MPVGANKGNGAATARERLAEPEKNAASGDRGNRGVDQRDDEAIPARNEEPERSQARPGSDNDSMQRASGRYV